jgi:uncharacterized protein (DUF488 family)
MNATTAKVFTLGDSGWTPEGIRAVLDARDAILVDVRLSPRSRMPQWSRSRLQNLLGDRYAHVRAFGNLNYKGDLGTDVMLEDAEAGIAQARELAASGRALVVMCGCKDHRECHRSDVAALLAQAMGLEIEHIELEA